jgi:hypothetical protein
VYLFKEKEKKKKKEKNNFRIKNKGLIYIFKLGRVEFSFKKRGWVEKKGK